MTETESLKIAIRAALDIRDAIDRINAERQVIAAYPDCITVDARLFAWNQLIRD